MKIRNKILLLLLITVGVFVVVTVGYEHIRLREQRIYIESKIKSDEVVINNILKRHTESYLNGVKNNSQWDEMINFTKKFDRKWAEDNINAVTFDFRLDFVNVYSKNKNLYYSYYDIDTSVIKAREVSITEEMLKFLFSKASFFSTFLFDKGELIEIVGAKIVPSWDNEFISSASGYLVAGKVWNKSYCSSLEKETEFTVKLNYLFDEKDTIQEGNIGVEKITKIIKDWQGRKIAHIHFTRENNLINKFRYSAYLSLIIIGFLLLTMILFYASLNKWIRKPLNVITKTLNTENVRLLQEIKSKKNEFGEIAKLIDVFYEQKKALKNEVNERKKNEIAIKHLNDELLEKHKEMEQIIYVTSHDLRSPLLNIQGFSKELEDIIKNIFPVINSIDGSPELKEKLNYTLKKDMSEIINYILSSGKKMDQLLNSLIKLSRAGRENINPKELDMEQLFTNIIRTFEFQIKEKGILIKKDNLPMCSGDEALVNQVFSNLIGNALKYLSPERKGIIKISGYTEDDKSIYCIEDNGIGIEKKNINKIFDIFYRLNPDKTIGEGIGLTIVSKILSKLKGKIWVESELDRGSKFFVSLPSTNCVIK